MALCHQLSHVETDPVRSNFDGKYFSTKKYLEHLKGWLKRVRADEDTDDEEEKWYIWNYIKEEMLLRKYEKRGVPSWKKHKKMGFFL